MTLVEFYKVFAAIFGLLLGSFLNVVIYRWPRELDIVWERSKCESCGKLVKWYENIPVLSYTFLLGKCSECKTKLSLRHPSIELLVGIYFYASFPTELTQMNLVYFAFYAVVFSCFVVHFFIDYDFKLLPNEVNLILAIVFLAFSIVNHSWTHYIFGFLVGFGMPYIVTKIFYVVRGVEGMGGGDIKLYGALGLFLGPIGIINNIFLSCFTGAIFGLILMAMKKMDKNNPLPFGPFILIIAFFQIFMPLEFKKVTEALFLPY